MESGLNKERYPSIDAFRGMAVLLMAAANYIAGINWIPAFLKHAPDIGYTVIDVIAPMFIMAVGFTTGLSARRRKERQGAAAALGGMATRFLAILGIGAIISAGQSICLPEGVLNWGVLQAIGAAGLLTLTVIFAPPWARAVAGLLLLAFYQWFISSPAILQTVLSSSHDGIIGAISWGGMLILATAAADWFFAAKTPAKRRVALLCPGAGALAAGLVLSVWFPISKNRASSSYMLTSLGICLLVFLLIHMLLDEKRPRLRLLQAVGRNPLAMYMAHLLLLGIVTLPGAANWYAEAPAWLAAMQGAALLSALLFLGWLMQKRGIILKL